MTVWEQEYQEAARLLEEALEGGFGEAGLLLGDLCRNHAEVLLPVALRGILPGVSRMETERKVGLKEAVPLAAVEYYKRSAELGCGDAMYWLGRSCDEGYGTEKDDAAALSWYFQAKEHGCELMWEELGTCYLIGKGTLNGIPNAPLGIEAFERVLEVGDSNWDDLDSVRVGLALAYAGQCGIKGYKYANFEREKNCWMRFPLTVPFTRWHKRNGENCRNTSGSARRTNSSIERKRRTKQRWDSTLP